MGDDRASRQGVSEILHKALNTIIEERRNDSADRKTCDSQEKIVESRVIQCCKGVTHRNRNGEIGVVCRPNWKITLLPSFSQCVGHCGELCKRRILPKWKLRIQLANSYKGNVPEKIGVLLSNRLLMGTRT